MSDTDQARSASPGGELERESSYVAMLYEQLDAYRAAVTRQLADVRLAPAEGTHQWRTERDALARQLERRLASLAIGDLPLCFGRLDLDDGARLHVGRVGIAGQGDEPLLMDWRAPKASLFYSATAGSPQGVVRRRHLLTRGRDVIAIDDEVFDLDALDHDGAADLHGDAALLAAVSRSRSGHMRDIVATIQREQDEVIRSELAGVLVVQGGPGTGKTAVALHRAAFLLYTHRVRLASNGVLVVGPNPTFLRYIEQVLPSLGETGALLATTHSLFPGVRPSVHDERDRAELKGRAEMATLLAKAVRDRERVPREDVEVSFERSRVRFDRGTLERARRIGRRSRRTHNQARRVVEATLLDAAMSQLRERLRSASGADPSNEQLNEARRALRRSRDFRVLMERIWPVLSAQELLNDLFGSAALLRSAAEGLDGLDVSLLLRERRANAEGVAWTIEDVPLLDEAAELLGSPNDEAEARFVRQRRAQRQRELDYASRVLSSMELDVSINVERFAERFAEQDAETIAEQAARDRTWRFGHVIVDEAQELSPMAWRMLFRRNPNRSMTVVGDLAQCSASWAPSSWGDVLEPYASGRWRVAELSVNYRTPSEIMVAANAVLALASPDTPPTSAIRSSGYLPFAVRADAPLSAAVVAQTRELLEEMDEGRIAVIAPPARRRELVEALEVTLGEQFDAHNPLAARVALVSVPEVKGLEYDAVLLVEPNEIIRSGARGYNDLYVALTRATQRLVVVHEGALEAVLAERLARR